MGPVSDFTIDGDLQNVVFVTISPYLVFKKFTLVLHAVYQILTES